MTGPGPQLSTTAAASAAQSCEPEATVRTGSPPVAPMIDGQDVEVFGQRFEAAVPVQCAGREETVQQEHRRGVGGPWGMTHERGSPTRKFHALAERHHRTLGNVGIGHHARTVGHLSNVMSPCVRTPGTSDPSCVPLHREAAASWDDARQRPGGVRGTFDSCEVSRSVASVRSDGCRLVGA